MTPARKSYQDYTRSKGLHPIGHIHRTSDKAEPGHIVLPGNGSRKSYVVTS